MLGRVRLSAGASKLAGLSNWLGLDAEEGLTGLQGDWGGKNGSCGFPAPGLNGEGRRAVGERVACEKHNKLKNSTYTIIPQV